MAGDSDSEDYITVGTPIERELEARAGGSRKAAGQDAGAVKALPVWKQAATDEQGRRRFHGAFTGGFSAGYFNTVGSKEGWAPKTFVSSRTARADGAALRRDARDFMDADELAEADASVAGALTTRDEYDTFGAQAAEAAHAAADRERAALDGARPAVLPGALLSDLVVPVSDPIGARLLRRMGWRVGKGVARKRAPEAGATPPRAATAAAVEPGTSAAPPPPRIIAAVEALCEGEQMVIAGDDAEAHETARGGEEGAPGDADEVADGLEAEAEDACAAAAAQRLRRRRRRWGAAAGALDEDIKVVVPPPKRDVHGLGYDPFAGAEEFRSLKRGRADAAGAASGGKQQAPGKRARAGAFGVGIFEAADDDVYGGEREETHFEVAPGSDDDEAEAVRFGGSLSGGRGRARLALGAAPTRLALGAPAPAGTLPGFVAAAVVEPPPKVFPPPVLPRGWQPIHKFAAPPAPPPQPPPPPHGGWHAAGPGPPPPPPPPADAELLARCDTLATFVARNGPSFEELARSRQRDDPRFSFLFGGPGAEYYAWRCAQLRATPAPPRPEQRSRPLTAEERGRILGEERLPGAPVNAAGQQHSGGLPGALMPPMPPPPPPPPPKGIAAGDRAALLASLGRTFTSASEPASSEHLQPTQQPYGLQPGVKLADKFAAGGTELAGVVHTSALPAAADAAAALPPPARTSDEWGPEPLLCKRFGVPDPYKGRPRPAERRSFRTDSFALPETAAAAAAAAPKFLAQTADSAAATVAAARPPPPPPALPPLLLQQLPPPPPLPPGMAPLHASQPAALAATAGAAADSAALADDFFASLGGPVPAQAPVEVAPAGLRPADKPIDLFKAIFEADEEEEDEPEDEEPQPPPELPPAAAAPTAAAAAAAGPQRSSPPHAGVPATLHAGPFSALAALAKEQEERRRKEKKAKKSSGHKHARKPKKKEKHDKKEKKRKSGHHKKEKKRIKARARSDSDSGSSSRSSSSSSGDGA